MALVPIRIRRTSKPPLGTPLRSDGHWGVEGLVGAWAFNEGVGKTAFDVVSGSANVLSGPVFNASGCLFDASDDYIDLGGFFRNYEQMSIIIPGINLQNISADHAVASNFSGLTFPGEWLLQFDRVSNFSTAAYVFNFVFKGIDAAALVVESSSVLDNKTYSLAVTHNKGVTASLYVNGVKSVGYTNALTATGINSQSYTTRLGYTAGSNKPLAGHLSGSLFYNRVLSPAEIASLSENPWQIYEPEIVWVWVEDSGGGTTFTQGLSGVFPSPIASFIRQINKSVTGVEPYPSADVIRQVYFNELADGTLPAPSGSIIKQTGKTITGIVPASNGGSVKQTTKSMAGTLPPPSGNPNEATLFHQAVTGIMSAMSGIVTTVLNPIVSLNKLMKIIGSSFRKIIGG